MQKLDALRQAVDDLYVANNPGADVWNDWGYENHVLFVAERTEKLAVAHNADVDLAVAGALTHDIADAVMARRALRHEAKSLEIAAELLAQCGYSADET